jgi:hypothetical protein
MNAMCKLLSDQLVELETRSSLLLVEPDTEGLHLNAPQMRLRRCQWRLSRGAGFLVEELQKWL